VLFLLNAEMKRFSFYCVLSSLVARFILLGAFLMGAQKGDGNEEIYERKGRNVIIVYAHLAS
jgi:hypothetical protein